VRRDTSRDTGIVWYHPERGYIFRDEEQSPESARADAAAEQAEADAFYAELKARLDERAPA
jgi:hypothetical protein